MTISTTALSISPMKNSTWINEIGENLEKEYGIKYLYGDFKKKKRKICRKYKNFKRLRFIQTRLLWMYIFQIRKRKPFKK